MKEFYLGDGVYISIENNMFKLRTDRENGEHFIYLDMFVYNALKKYVESLQGTR